MELSQGSISVAHIGLGTFICWFVYTSVLKMGVMHCSKTSVSKLMFALLTGTLKMYFVCIEFT
jgi:hypothetical protein